MAGHTRFTLATDIKVYFCDPQTHWQRGTNENTNGLLRQYFPKGTDLSGYSQAKLDDWFRILAANLYQHDIATITLDESRNLAAPIATQQIAFPVTGYRSIFNLGRPLTDRDHIENPAVIVRLLRVMA